MSDSSSTPAPPPELKGERDYSESKKERHPSMVGPQFESKGPDPYYEIKVVKGDDNEFVIGVGYGPANYRAGAFPGWRTNSYGVHGDDGGFFDGHGFLAKSVTRAWKPGDVIGVGINPTRREMYWTLNGEVVHTVENIVLLMYHAIIGLRDAKDRIEVNFGTRPFVYKAPNLPDGTAKISSTGLITLDNKDIRVEPLLDEAVKGLSSLIWKVEVINTHKMNVMSDAPLLVPSHSIHGGDAVYYEVEVVEAPKNGNGAIGLGWALPHVAKEQMPGWTPGSYGWHSDDGCLYREQGWPLDAYGTKPQTGDVVGCGIERSSSTGQGAGLLQIFYTLNGKHLGVAFKSVPIKNYIMLIGMVAEASSVRINTTGPFVYPFEYKTQQEKMAVRLDGVDIQADTTDVYEFSVKQDVGQILGTQSIVPNVPESDKVSMTAATQGKAGEAELKQAKKKDKAYPVANALRLLNLREILVDGPGQDKEMSHVTSLESWVQDRRDDQDLDALIRRVFDFVDEDCNGSLGYLETCIGLCYLIGKQCLESERLTSLDGEDLLPKQAGFKEVDKDQFKELYLRLLQDYLKTGSSTNTKGEACDFRGPIVDNYAVLQKFFKTTPVARRIDSVGCTYFTLQIVKRIMYFFAYVLFPFIFLKSCLQDLILDGNTSRGKKCGLVTDVLLAVLFVGLVWPLLVGVYYIGLVAPVLYGIYFPDIKANGHLVSGTEVVVPMFLILLVLFFALKNGWAGEESVGCLRSVTGVYDAVMHKEFTLLQASKSELYQKAWEKRLRPYRDFLVTVDTFSLQGVKEQMRLGDIMKKLRGQPSQKPVDVTKRFVVKYILPIAFAVGAGIVPGLVRVVKLHTPFFGQTKVEIVIAVLYLVLTIPTFYLVLNGLSNIISEHARQLKMYRTLRDVTTAKGVSTTSQLKFYVDLSYSRNIDKWMEMRRTAIEDQRHRDRSQFIVGPIIVADLALASAVFYRVLTQINGSQILSLLGSAIDISNLLAIYLALVTFGYILALLIVLVQQNEMITTQHIKMMMQRKYRMARNLWDVDDHDKEQLRRQILVLESAVNRVQTSENRVEILGLVVDRPFAVSVTTAVLTGSLTGILRLAGVI